MPNSTNPRLVPMVIGLHVMLAVAAGLLPVLLPVSDYLDDVPAAIIALSQMSLLSLWIGFGHGNLLLRLGVVFVAGICLTSTILCADAGGWPSFKGIDWFVVGIITFSPVPCVAIPAWITRIRWAEVHREMLGDLPVRATGFSSLLLMFYSGRPSLYSTCSLPISRWNQRRIRPIDHRIRYALGLHIPGRRPLRACLGGAHAFALPGDFPQFPAAGGRLPWPGPLLVLGKYEISPALANSV